MLVVADTSPIQYLVLIAQADVLPQLFGHVFVPKAVIRELNHGNAPQAVRDFMVSRPDWLTIQDPRRVNPIPGIDLGEQAAISLAQEMGADLLLIDDLDGRRAAQSRGIAITGTLGVLERAADHGLLDLRESIEKLQATSMHLSQSLVASLLARRQRPSGSPGDPDVERGS
jgi:predicted nucleic acid-binding protein